MAILVPNKVNSELQTEIKDKDGIKKKHFLW